MSWPVLAAIAAIAAALAPVHARAQEFDEVDAFDVRENVLPNTLWKIYTTHPASTQMTPVGSTMAPLAVTSYSTGSNEVVFRSQATRELKVGDLVRVDDPGAPEALRRASIRVDALTPNASFTGSLPHGATVDRSTPLQSVRAIAPGGLASIGSGDAIDGWSKFPPCARPSPAGCAAGNQTWRETNRENAKDGSPYSLAFKKGGPGPEYLFHVVPDRDVPRYRGRRLAVGAWVLNRRGDGASWYARVATSGLGGGITRSTAETRPGWHWREVSAVIPRDATRIELGFGLEGPADLVYYVSQPVAGLGRRIGAETYVPAANELFVPVVKMTPMTWFGARIDFPSRATGADGEAGFWFRPYPETDGAIAPTVRGLVMQLEARCDDPGTSIALRNRIAPPVLYSMLRYAKVSGAMEAAEGIVLLNANPYPDGPPGPTPPAALGGMGDVYVYTNRPGARWYGVSIDINAYHP